MPEPEELPPALMMDGPPLARSTLWESVLKRSLQSGDFERVEAAISLAENGGACPEVLVGARRELCRLAEVALVAATQGGDSAALTTAVERADDAGASVDLLHEAQQELQRFAAAGHRRTLAERSRSGASVAGKDVTPAVGLAAAFGTGGRVPSVASSGALGVQDEAVVHAAATLRQRPSPVRRRGEPRRSLSPGQVAPAVIGRSSSGVGMLAADSREAGVLGKQRSEKGGGYQAPEEQPLPAAGRGECVLQ
mmetsp:Transcript_1070/g.2595  ORF Transcript_1070/g.2595 Transcript_1070/m.2595 type:complete len:252 (+) Transcript_1070:65-820(+)